MALVKAQCTNCGANLEVDNQKDAAICPFCNTPYVVEKAIQKITNNTTNITNNYYQTSGFTFSSAPTRNGKVIPFHGKDPVVVEKYEISHRFDNVIDEGYYLKSDGTLGYFRDISCRPENCTFAINPIPFTWRNLVDFEIRRNESSYVVGIVGTDIDGKQHSASLSIFGEYGLNDSQLLERKTVEQSKKMDVDCIYREYNDKDRCLKNYQSYFYLRTDGIFEAITDDYRIRNNISLLQKRGDKYIGYFYPGYCLTTNGRLDRAMLEERYGDISITRGVEENVISFVLINYRTKDHYLVYSDGTAKFVRNNPYNNEKKSFNLFVGNASDYKKTLTDKVPDPFDVKANIIKFYEDKMKLEVEYKKKYMSANPGILLIYMNERKEYKKSFEEKMAKYQHAIEIAKRI